MGLSELFLLRVAKRWISGVNLDSAVADALKANARGMGVVVNFLGEEISDPKDAEASVEEYLRLQRAISERSIQGFVSVKLTQFGLGTDSNAAAERLERVARSAQGLGQMAWLDMEGSKFTAETIDIYTKAFESHKELGLALQAYMRRSESDLKRLLDSGARIRLVKGAYREASDVVFPTRKEVSSNYRKLMAMLFERGEKFAIGTHDSALINEAKKLAESKHVEFRFEMLKGIRDELKGELVNSGYKVSEYLPYGDKWFAYSKRRITEHPGNIWLLLRSLV